MAEGPILIIQVPRGSAIERQLQDEPPPALAVDDVLVQTGPTDGEGNLEELAGEVVLSVPAPGELARHADDLQRVLGQAGAGTAPLVIVVEAAEELEDDQAAPVVAAARDAPGDPPGHPSVRALRDRRAGRGLRSTPAGGGLQHRPPQASIAPSLP